MLISNGHHQYFCLIMRYYLLCLCLCLTSPLLHAEVYKWVDADGVTHFGDRQPNSGKSQKLDVPPPQQAADTAKSSVPQEDYRARQQKLLNAMSEERALKQEKAQKQAEQQAKIQRNCQHAKDYLNNISSGRIYSLNNQGERVYANDAEQTAEIAKTKELIRQNCQ